MTFRCVPFDPRWTGDTKLDMKAIYRRPSPGGWDLTSGLPLRRHAHWQAKGFQYVTLADGESLTMAAPFLLEHGLDPASFVVSLRTGSPWDPAQYLAALEVVHADEDRELAALVAKHGAAATEEILRVSRPGFVLPAKYRAAGQFDALMREQRVTAPRKRGRPAKAEAVAG